MKTKTPSQHLRNLILSMYQEYPSYYVGPYEQEFPEDVRDNLQKNNIIIKAAQKNPQGKSLYTLGNTGMLLAQAYQRDSSLVMQRRVAHQLKTVNFFLSSLIVVVLLVAFLMLIIPLS